LHTHLSHTGLQPPLSQHSRIAELPTAELLLLLLLLIVLAMLLLLLLLLLALVLWRLAHCVQQPVGSCQGLQVGGQRNGARRGTRDLQHKHDAHTVTHRKLDIGNTVNVGP
jgi:hypothetical protein